MSTIIQEAEVSLNTLAQLFEDVGYSVELDNPESIHLNTDSGLGFRIRVDAERKFVLFRTFLPVSKDYADGLELANELNSSIFLGSFCMDSDGDILVGYEMAYARGLIAAQLTRVTRRFASMLEHVVDKYSEQPVFDFASMSETTASPAMIQ